MDTSLIIDTMIMHERMASYGIRELWRVVEKIIADDIYQRRKEGCKQVTLKVEPLSNASLMLPVLRWCSRYAFEKRSHFR